MIKNIDYVVISEIPEIQQERFKYWLRGQTQPIIEEEGDNKFDCAYKWDYDKFLAYYRKNQVAPITD
jgi:hypothetical protein